MAPRRTKAAAVAALAVAILVVAGCGGGDDQGATTTTKAKPSGTLTFDPETSNPEYKEEDGDTYELGENVSVPDGWPEALVPPATTTIDTARTAHPDGAEELTITGSSTETSEATIAAVRAQLEAAGFEITEELNTEAGDFRNVKASGDGFDADFTVMLDLETQKVTVRYKLTATG